MTYNADTVDTEMPTMKKTISLVSLAVAAAAAAAIAIDFISFFLSLSVCP